jgi:hypothetical protein
MVGKLLASHYRHPLLRDARQPKINPVSHNFGARLLDDDDDDDDLEDAEDLYL